MSLSPRSRSEELAARVPKPERAPVAPVSVEEEPEAESFENRGDRILSQAAAQVKSTWSGLYSRLSSFGNRLSGMMKTGLGGTAAGLEAGATIAGKTIEGGAEVVRGIPTIAGGIGEHLYDEAAGLAEGYHDMIRPREAADMEAVSAVELRMQRLQETIAELDPGPGRNELVEKYEALTKERDQLLDTPRSLRGSKAAAEALAATKSGLKKGASAVGAGLAMGAMGAAALGTGAANKVAEGGRWAGRKVGEMREARRQEQERLRIEQEEARVARAELFLMDAAEASGEPVQKLSRKALILLGTKLEESLARRLGEGLKAAVMYDDVVEIGAGLKAGALSFAAFARSPEDRAWLINELKEFNTESGKAIEEALKTVGRKAVIEPVVRGGRAAGRLAQQAAVGTVAVGAGLAIAGVEAAANSRPARAAKKAAIAEWQKHGPAVTKGFANGVKSLNQFADNVLDITDGDALERAGNELTEKLNAEAEKASGFFNRMRALVESAVNIAQRKWNEFMLEIAQGAAKAENPKLVAKIGDAVQALGDVEAAEGAQAKAEDAPPISQTALRRPRPKTIRPTVS